MSDAKKSFMGSLKVSAEIAKKQSIIKKREITDLKAVYAKIGDYAFQNQINRDQLTEQFAAIELLDTEVEKKRTHEAVADTATLADKAKHTATVTKDRAAVEALLLRRKSLVTELGRILCGYEVEDKTVQGLQQDAQNIGTEIEKLKADVLELKRGVSGIAKRPFLAVAIAVIAFCVVIGSMVDQESDRSRSGKTQMAQVEEEQTVTSLRKAADAGDSDAMLKLGNMYSEGQGVEQDAQLAVEWYRKAADAGNSTAMGNLGFMYEQGQGVKQDQNQALAWFRKSADNGGVMAMNYLGLKYKEGLGVRKDFRQAAMWFRKAADAGDEMAMTTLAWMYEWGHGVEQDHNQAAIWNQKAVQAQQAD